MLILWTFLGLSDRKAATMQVMRDDDCGPLARALLDPKVEFDHVHIIDDMPQTGAVAPYVTWLLAHLNANNRPVPIVHIHSNWPSDRRAVDLRAVYAAASAALDSVTAGPEDERVYNLSSGTSSMTTVFVLLANSEHYGGRSLFVDRVRGIEWVEIPFDIRYALRRPLEVTSGGPHFDASRILSSFIVDSKPLRAELALAQRVALFNYTVLILGESGTGKEEVAFHMHLWRLWGAQAGELMRAPGRVAKARSTFRAVNCAGLSDTLFESELFGYEKGAFTGAIHDSPGMLRDAGTGTVFLDEIGDLSHTGQAKLLRALQTRTVRPVGSAAEVPFQARVIAATHRNLYDMARRGHFREDLLNRITEGAIIRLPALRVRGDAESMAQQLLVALCAEANGLLPAMRLSEGALARIREHAWPGNVRELLNILRQASVRARSDIITEQEISACLDARLDDDEGALLGRALPVQLKDLHLDLDRHYLGRALAESGSKAKAARLVGFSSAQRFSDRYNSAMADESGEED